MIFREDLLGVSWVFLGSKLVIHENREWARVTHITLFQFKQWLHYLSVILLFSCD